MDEMVHLAAEGNGRAMGEVTAVIEFKRKDGVARINEGMIGGKVSLGAAMGLDVSERDVKELLGPFDANGLHRVDVFATAIIAMPREAFRVFGDENARHRLARLLRRIVLGADKLDAVILPFRL